MGMRPVGKFGFSGSFTIFSCAPSVLRCCATDRLLSYFSAFPLLDCVVDGGNNAVTDGVANVSLSARRNCNGRMRMTKAAFAGSGFRHQE